MSRAASTRSRSIWGTSSLPPSCHTCSGGRRRRRQNCRSVARHRGSGHGAGRRRRRPHGVAAVCSFYATKVITSGGEGGMVLTDDQALAQAVRELREYDGLLPDRQRWNYKLTDVGAAVGRVQLRRLPQLLERLASTGRAVRRDGT
ncbi:MAG: DegT/DnrJ/EryC1/StrS family aminotransferase [Candidatus Latescibacterota bacterium]